MRSIALCLLPFLCLAAGQADIEALIGEARSAPPEFAADALIRLAGLSQIDKARRMAMLDEAFQDAAASPQPYKRRFAELEGGGPARFYNQVSNQELDGLSLRLRAVEAMLPLDARKARDLFVRIAPPDFPRLTCSDFMVYDLARLYEVAGRVAAQGFNAAENARGEPLGLIMRYTAVASPAQVGPAARLLVSAGLTERNFQNAAAAFAAALSAISGDDRSFTASAAAGPQIQALAKECERRGMSPAVVIEAYRTYLAHHLSAARCADSPDGRKASQQFGLVTAGAEGATADAALAFFNNVLAGPSAQPIDRQQATASRREGSVPAWPSCQDTGCRGIVERYRALVMGPGNVPHQARQKTTMEWKDQLDQLLSAMASWKESPDTTTAQFFREKAEIYTDLLAIVADDDGRKRVARANLAFLSQSRFRAENSLEWFLPVSVLIGRARLDPLVLAWLTEELVRSPDPLIGLYADLEKIAPRAPGNILSLM